MFKFLQLYKKFDISLNDKVVFTELMKDSKFLKLLRNSNNFSAGFSTLKTLNALSRLFNKF